VSLRKAIELRDSLLAALRTEPKVQRINYAQGLSRDWATTKNPQTAHLNSDEH